MATNTAFGTLPSPTTQLFGGNAGGGSAGAPPTPPKPRVQGAQGLAPGSTLTFAQMQQQGQARPAPAAGTAAPAQQQQPPMLSALNTQLNQPAQPRQASAAVQGLDKLPANVMEALNQNELYAGGGYAQGGFGGGGIPNTNFVRDASGNTTITVRDEAGDPQQYSNASAQPEQPQQYAQAQSAGYQSSGAFGGSSQAQALRARLEQQLNDLSQNEAQLQGQSYSALRKAKMDEMGAEFGAQRSQIEEDLARRGLSASTIGGGRYGDLAGQQARATASFEADLLKQQAEAEAKNRQMYLSGMSELAGMAGQQDLGTFEANLKSRQADADISLRTQELQQEGMLKGRELTLQEARDLATKEYQGGQLQQGYADIASKERMSASDIASRQAMQQSQFGFDREQSGLERNLRSAMQERELTSEEARQLRQIDATRALQTENLTAEERRQLTQIAASKDLQTDAQTFQAGQSALERGLREKMQTQQLTSEEKRQLAQIEANRASQLSDQTFQGGQSQLERDLRKQMQEGQITAEGQRQLTQINATRSLQEGQQTWQAGQTAEGNRWQAEQSALDRDLRKTLSKDEITAASDRFKQQFGLDEKRFNMETAQGQNSFLATLAQTLAPLDATKRAQILASLGIKTPGAPGSSSTPKPGEE